jgi:hypothetical protein
MMALVQIAEELGRTMKEEEVISMRDRGLRYLLMLITGAYLLSQPQCRKGCKTVAEHLLRHGVQGLLS